MKLLLLLIFIGTTQISFSQNAAADCSLFQTGDFAFRDSVSNILWKIKRTKHQQTETNEATGLIIKNKIRWISPCEYKLTQTWANKKEQRKRNNTSTTYRIVSSGSTMYQYTCNCSDGTKVTGTVVKLPG